MSDRHAGSESGDRRPGALTAAGDEGAPPLAKPWYAVGWARAALMLLAGLGLFSCLLCTGLDLFQAYRKIQAIEDERQRQIEFFRRHHLGGH